MPPTFRALKRRLAELPRTVAADVASRAAPTMTKLTGSAFDAGRDVYGVARPKSEADGRPLTLHRSGKAEASLRFVAVGTIVRAVFAVPYLKYLVGKYRVLPNGPIPVAWRGKLDELVRSSGPGP